MGLAGGLWNLIWIIIAVIIIIVLLSFLFHLLFVLPTMIDGPDAEILIHIKAQALNTLLQ